jgi:hypothetical protein
MPSWTGSFLIVGEEEEEEEEDPFPGPLVLQT